MSISIKETKQTKPKLKYSYKKIILRVSIVLVVTFFLLPILWQILTSLKVNEDISAIPTIYFPSRLTLDHYLELFSRRPFALYILNSALVSLISTVLCLAIGSPAAYGLARLKLPGESIILAGILVITLFPYVLLFLGLLEVIKFFNLGNNYLALIIPYTAINLPLTILVMRSFFQQLPRDLEDAAKIDGYNTLGMLINILLPLTAPALVTTGILTFIFAWNEYIFALTFITQESLKTIPVATAQLGGATVFEIPYGPIAAATVLGTFPLVLLVLFFQRRIVQGLTAGAVKG
ncbi:binding-protein-dependent transport systems inner membrane component [Gloeothece citriformis PCC 7424]|uniref:Binding-protein-dependent transport systems inner membrane component n=1 Tax=Gloeothece citriformis (strain PCC 7424) TaxID=65393 RepID=B7KDM7_GLOC7|nr:carbohydrate ABC transporter permease [Gloeothece citriformis]ACK70329.1 binding-protein-dependent transport systems inner membrane component [Gloeothece citriformis PCC 7424]